MTLPLRGMESRTMVLQARPATPSAASSVSQARMMTTTARPGRDRQMRVSGVRGIRVQTPPSTPEQPRDEPVVAALLALAAQHHWGALEYGPGHVVGGSEAAWRRFAVHGLVEDRYAALERLKALPGAEPGSRLPGSRNGGIA